MAALTAIQSQVLAFVRSYRAEHQVPPTCAEISEHFGWSSRNSAVVHLQALEKKGHIRLGHGRARAIFDLSAVADQRAA